MNLFKIPGIVPVIYKRFEWKYPNHEKKIYLTFDDGPCPGVTEWILDKLDSYNIKATFFCVGKNVRYHPEIYREILNRGNKTGNHTYNHSKNRSLSPADYLEEVIACEPLIKSFLFRPPYGRISKQQATFLMERGYRIIMYTVLANDFNPHNPGIKILRKLIKQTTAGSIIVFHDSYKAEKNMKEVLPAFIETMLEKKYQFSVIE